ncbi:hypothetical protein NDU88_007021 [Pleurodeles waltl]|uniref:Peptidase A2 domain-containing protein n=1 Tax=Pleurodeles waltl TaxID=8319 RepID=A0AAV7TYN9_PLEWA|nr:hypothetical protein NDU88_007021 [Pleurodeles waltl]
MGPGAEIVKVKRDRNETNDRYERKDRNNRYDQFDRDEVQPLAPHMPRDIKQTQHSLRNPFQERHGSALDHVEIEMTQTTENRQAQCFMMKVSETLEEIPMFLIKVGGKEIDFLIDSGATISAVRNKLGPSSGKTVTTVAVNGMLIHEELSEPLPVSVEDFAMTHRFLLSPDAPINLLERDLLSKLHATLYFSQNGIYLQVPEERLELANKALTACKLSEDSMSCPTPVLSLSNTLPMDSVTGRFLQ